MLPDSKRGCHRTGFTRKCRDLLVSEECNRWIMIEGTNPANGQPLSQWDCVDNWPIALLIDIAKKLVNGNTGVENAVLSFRNEMVEAQSPIVSLMRLQKPV
jgi:hypothetical protein